MLRERLDLRRQVPGGVLDVVRLVRPPEPQVVRPARRGRPRGARRRSAGSRSRGTTRRARRTRRPVVGVVVVPVLEEHRGRVAREHGLRAPRGSRTTRSRTGSVFASSLSGIEPTCTLASPRSAAASSISRTRVAASSTDLGRDPATAIAVREDRQVHLAAGGGPLGQHAARADLRVVGMREDHEDRAGPRLAVALAHAARSRTKRTRARTGASARGRGPSRRTPGRRCRGAPTGRRRRTPRGTTRPYSRRPSDRRCS